MDTRLIVADILEGNLGSAKTKTESLLYQKSGEILEGFSSAIVEDVYGLSLESKKKAKVTDKDDDGEGMDPVGAEDDDIDNDGDSDDSDDYLKNRRKTVKKAINKDDGDEEEATEGYGKKMKEEEGKKKKKGSHNCANHVEHAEWGQGIPVHGEHATPDEDGYVQWYNVEFEHGIEEHVFTEDLTILGEGMHEDHDHHDGEQIDELAPLVGLAAKALTSKVGLATAGYMLGKSKGKKDWERKQRMANSGGAGMAEDMEIYGMSREKYSKLPDQEKQAVKQAYRSKKAVTK